MSKYAGLIARTGSDFQNLLSFFNSQQLRLISNRIWLRNSLPCFNRKRFIGISKFKKSFIHKKMTRHSSNCSQHPFILNSFFSNSVHQLPPQALVTKTVFKFHFAKLGKRKGFGFM